MYNIINNWSELYMCVSLLMSHAIFNPTASAFFFQTVVVNVTLLMASMMSLQLSLVLVSVETILRYFINFVSILRERN